MIFLYSFLLVLNRVIADDLRFCALPADIQSLKSSKQIDSHYATFREYYTIESSDPVMQCSNMNIFMYLDQKELAAFIEVTLKTGLFTEY